MSVKFFLGQGGSELSDVARLVMFLPGPSQKLGRLPMQTENGFRPQRRAVRNGFSRLELLLTAGIFCVMAALLAPTLQSAREASRRSLCRARLHRISISLNNYHSQYDAMPAGLETGANGPTRTAWLALLPELSPPFAAAFATQPDNLMWFERDQTFRVTTPELMRCPSGTSPMSATLISAREGSAWLRSEFGVADYALATGLGSPYDITQNAGFESERGVFGTNYCIRRDQIRDGASYTIAFGEATGGDPWPLGRGIGSTTAVLKGGQPLTAATPWLATFPEADLERAGIIAASPFAGPFSAINTRPVSHTTGWDFSPSRPSPKLPELSVSGFRSNHGQGAHFATCDGGVRFIHVDIHPEVFRDFFTISGAGAKSIQRRDFDRLKRPAAAK